MTNDPIVDEVHRTREKLLAQYNGDLRALIEDARLRTEEAARAGHPVRPPPPAQPVEPAKKVG